MKFYCLLEVGSILNATPDKLGTVKILVHLLVENVKCFGTFTTRLDEVFLTYPKKFSIVERVEVSRAGSRKINEKINSC